MLSAGPRGRFSIRDCKRDLTMAEAAKLANRLPQEGLLAEYRPPAGVFDEMVAPDGVLRSPWEQFIGGVNRTGGPRA